MFSDMQSLRKQGKRNSISTPKIKINIKKVKGNQQSNNVKKD